MKSGLNGTSYVEISLVLWSLREHKNEKLVTVMANNESRKILPRRSTHTEVRQSCFFCEETSGELHRASTFNLDRNVRESAHILNDTFLLGKLSAGDMVALDAMYHTQCLSKLYKRAIKVENQIVIPTDNDSICQSIALAELVSFLEEF